MTDRKVVGIHGPKGREYDAGGVDGNGGGPHDGAMEARVAALETDVKYIRRDLDEVRTDVRAILARLGSLDSSVSLMAERLSSVPTKLQMALALLSGVILVLGSAFGIIAFLMRINGHHEAADVLDSARGK